MFSAASLNDKYEVGKGHAYLNGTQALVRLALVQAARDRDFGLNTGGFVSGYRGSPLGSVDMEFERAVRWTKNADIHFVPGVNEDLAATSVMGTQQINLLEKANKDGVFAMWYGKGPGVDRSGDAFRHGNLAGSAEYGGVLVLAGDDHICKSSTTSHQSEYALMDAMIPVLSAANISDIVPFGLYGFALSRYSGCWTSLKLVTDVVDSSGSVDFIGENTSFAVPTDFEMPPGGLNIRWPDTPQEQERRLHNFKIPAALAFARANPVDHLTMGADRGRLGIMATGKAYVDTLQALEDMGIDDRAAKKLGIGVYKVGLVWPLEPQGTTQFACAFNQVLVVEEKRSLIELQLKEILFNLPADRRPRIAGKDGVNGEGALPSHDDLNRELISQAIWVQISNWPEIAEVGARLRALRNNVSAYTKPPVERTPYFCSGCPHNTSTRVPEGSRAMAGIGCHWMSQMMDRSTATYTHMGGEGANWIGQAPFVPTDHIFQNMGDGTFYHSGLLAIRAAVAANARMTYKILFNDAVAMTGGQTHDGPLSAQRITQMVRSEGVERIAVVADDPDKYINRSGFANGATIHSRDDLDAVQRELREYEGVSVLVYDQVCAATKRRRKKRAGPALEKRVLINDRVCEGCGDCSVKSNCLSVVPVQTEFGRKRMIDQTSCNLDHSCLTGFCPSFVTVEGTQLRKTESGALPDIAEIDVPQPILPSLETPINVLITGVGGTGVVTIGAILAMAAHLSGKGCSTLDMVGMAQKGGPVTTHLRFGETPADLHSTRISTGMANLVLGCDSVTSAGKEASAAIGAGTTRVILNIHESITAQFVRDRDFSMPTLALVKRLKDRAGPDHVQTVDATAITTRLLKDAMGTNLFMVGYAYQCGEIPVAEDAILRAVELNGAAVEMNKIAFRLGRIMAYDRSKIEALMQDGSQAMAKADLPLDELIDRRAEFLTEYQNRAYADRYRAFVDMVRHAEQEKIGTEEQFSRAVATYLFKLMAYKDEYEVARLHSSQAFRQRLEQTFEPGGKLSFYLAPPLLSKIDPVTREPRKKRFGAWMMHGFAVLAKLKGLRGTAFDPFGYLEERRVERQLIDDYRHSIEETVNLLSSATYETAVAIASIPEDIKGYGPIKDRSLVTARQRWRELEQEMQNPQTGSQPSRPERKPATV